MSLVSHAEPISLGRLRSELNWQNPNPGYGFEKVFGCLEPDPATGLGPGIHHSFRAILEDIYATGSFVSADSHDKNINARSPQVQSIRDKFWEGGFSDNNLDWRDRLAIQTIVSSSGKNMDFYGFDQQNDLERSNRQLYMLLKLSSYVMVDTGPRHISFINYFDHFFSIHLCASGQSENAGINIMCLDQANKIGEHDDRHTSMLSIRRDLQTAATTPSQSGIDIKRGTLPLKNATLEMTGEPQSIGEFLRYTSKAIATIVVNNLLIDQLDEASFLQAWGKAAINTKISFEEAIEFMNSLKLASMCNPQVTNELIDQLGLRQYIMKIDEKVIKELFKHSDTQLLSISSSDSHVIADYMASVMKFSPLTLEEWRAVVPTQLAQVLGEPVNRGEIKVYTDPFTQEVCSATSTCADGALVMFELAKKASDPTTADLIRTEATRIWQMARII